MMLYVPKLLLKVRYKSSLINLLPVIIGPYSYRPCDGGRGGGGGGCYLSGGFM